eukprot:1926622-Amphidinium_carterae.1
MDDARLHLEKVTVQSQTASEVVNTTIESVTVIAPKRSAQEGVHHGQTGSIMPLLADSSMECLVDALRAIFEHCLVRSWR